MPSHPPSVFSLITKRKALWDCSWCICVQCSWINIAACTVYLHATAKCIGMQWCEVRAAAMACTGNWGPGVNKKLGSTPYTCSQLKQYGALCILGPQGRVPSLPPGSPVLCIHTTASACRVHMQNFYCWTTYYIYMASGYSNTSTSHLSNYFC